MARPSIRRELKREGLAPARTPKERESRGARPAAVLLPGEPPDAGPLDIPALFGRQAPAELEIGTGKGRFLLNEAERHPERCFLGLELQGEYARIANARAEKRGLSNVRVARVDGKAFVSTRLREGSLA